jgi:anti-sigma regulatory factor (Ser/Thr protein kinase)
MTMLQLRLDSDLTEIGRLAEALEVWAEPLDLPMKVVMETNLMLDELITNIITYGYGGTAGSNVDVSIEIAGDTLRITLADDAPEFNLLEAADTDTTASLDDRDIGGLGIHFVRKLASRIDYARRDNRNVVTLEKALPGRAST